VTYGGLIAGVKQFAQVRNSAGQGRIFDLSNYLNPESPLIGPKPDTFVLAT